MSIYHVPHLAPSAEMKEDFENRSALVAYRQFLSDVGVTQKPDMYMHTYFWEIDEQIILSVLMALAIGFVS